MKFLMPLGTIEWQEMMQFTNCLRRLCEAQMKLLLPWMLKTRWIKQLVHSIHNQFLTNGYIYGLHVLDGPLMQVSVGCTSLKIWAFKKLTSNVDLCV
jgi:hypothetical protein